MRMFKYVLLMLSLCSAAFAGPVVKCIQPDGTAVFTNQRCIGGTAEKVKLRSNNSLSSTLTVEFAFAEQQSNVEVSGEGVVGNILEDDNSDGRHQRFIVKLASGQTVLIAHNIDLAPRIDTLQTGDSVKFYGEYLWNEKGGIVHWTHHDPKDRHAAGWLEHDGRRYE